MSIEIKVPFPKYEGMEVKKVTADIEKGYSVVEYGEKEPIEKNILVPESIGIYKTIVSLYGDNLFIAFNNDNQFLGFNSRSKQWFVTTDNHDNLKKVQCKLTPCKREELREGDTIVMYSSCIVEPNLNVTHRYYKVLPDNKYAKANAENVSVITIEGKYSLFKVEPIQ